MTKLSSMSLKLMSQSPLSWYVYDRVATVREKVLEVREKSGNYIFSQGNLKKNKKSHGKVSEFQNFPKKMLVNRLLEILVSIICKQFMFRNIPFLIFIV